MADEEIRIKVTEEREGTALRDAQRDKEKLERPSQAAAPAAAPAPSAGVQERRAVDAKDQARQGSKSDAVETRQAAVTAKVDALEAQAGGRPDEAKAIEREAQILSTTAKLQRELNISAAEATVIATRQIDAEAEITRQEESQAQLRKKEIEDRRAAQQQSRRQAQEDRQNAAVEKGRESFVRRGLATGIRATEQAAAGGGSPLSALSGIMSVGTNPYAIAAATALAVGSIIVGEQIKKDYQSKQADAENLRAMQGFALSKEEIDRKAQTPGGESEERLRAEIAELKAKRGTFVDTPILDSLKGAFGLETTSKEETRKNERSIVDKEGQLGAAGEADRERFEKNYGPEELSIQEALLRGDGKRAAAIKDQVEYEKERRRMLGLKASDAEAEESAGIAVAQAQRERALAWGRLVSSRSGSADIARAASLASGGFHSGDIGAKLDSLHETVRNQSAAALAAVGGGDYRSPHRKLF